MKNDSNENTKPATREVHIAYDDDGTLLWAGDKGEVERAAKRLDAAHITKGQADAAGNVTDETTVWAREAMPS